MSLIQEALKRQQMEQEGHLPSKETSNDSLPLTPETPQNPSQDKPASLLSNSPSASEPKNSRPPPLDSVAKVETAPRRNDQRRGSHGRPRKHSVMPALLTAFVILILLGGIVIWAFLAGFEMLKSVFQDAPEAPIEVSIERETSPQPPSPERFSHDHGQIATPARRIGETTAPPSKIVSTEGVPSAEAEIDLHGTIDPDQEALPEIDLKTADETVADLVTELPAVEERDDSDVSSTVVSEPAIWPELRVSGVAGSASRGAAFINGNVVGVNERISGVRVLAIKGQSVLLEYQNETRLIKVGQTTRHVTTQ